ncbi:hypothetical protein Scep_019617 [Stephania cephalantha]|uniref:Uncharacterized protein n=1 Tax=Stephania cephalantha TaxID=152367 RepID=A0AAP0IBI9_9MAGN
MINWEEVCESQAKGGLRIHTSSQMNIALQAKIAWKILTKVPALLVKVSNAKYLQQQSLLQAKRCSSDSSIWKAILYGSEAL